MITTREIAAIMLELEHSGDPWEVNKPDAELIDLDIDALKIRTSKLHEALQELFTELHKLDWNESDSEDYQQVFYHVGKKHYGKENLRKFFADIYLLLTRRTSSGSRLGIIVKILGVNQFIKRITRPINWDT